MKHASKITSFFAFPTIVLLSHLVASKVLNLYLIFPNLDIPYHYIGGFSIAYLSAQFLSYLEKEKIFIPLSKVISLVLIFSLTSTSTVFWEFAEFIGDQLLDTTIQVSLANTMRDQFMGILGGATWVFIYFKRVEKIT